MASDKIKKARDLVDEGKYAQARRLLKGNNDPKAKRLMEEINDNAPANSGGTGFRDFLHVVVLGLLFTALFGGIGYVIASGMGITPAVTTTPTREAQSLSSDVTPGTEQSVAIEPSVTPPPTEIPCAAQAWWDTNSATTAQVVNNLLDLSIETPGQQIQANKQAFDSWRATVEGESVAPCLSGVKQGIVSAAPLLEAVYNTYLTASTDQERTRAVLQMMDGLLPLTDELEKLNVTGADDRWIDIVQNFTRADCPGARWIAEILIIRDYKSYFVNFGAGDITQLPAAELQKMLVDFRTGRSSFAAESVAFPACVKPASDHFLALMDAMLGALNAYLNNDTTVARQNLDAINIEWAAFVREVEIIST